jgi:hypothetical protein
MRCHAEKLMILAIEIGLIHRKGVYQLLDFMFGVRPQQGEITLERQGPGDGNPFDDPTVYVVALVVVERHARSAIQELAETPYIFLSNVYGSRFWAVWRCHSGG